MLKAELGLSILEGMNDLASDATAAKSIRDYERGNMALWRSRLKKFGGPDMENATDEGDEMQQQVRIDSPDHHYHYPPQSGIPSWVKTAALLLGGGGIAAAGGSLIADKLFSGDMKPPAVTKPIDNGGDSGVGLNPGGLQIEVIKGQ